MWLLQIIAHMHGIVTHDVAGITGWLVMWMYCVNLSGRMVLLLGTGIGLETNRTFFVSHTADLALFIQTVSKHLR